MFLPPLSTHESRHIVGPRHVHDLYMAIGEIVPENDRKAAGDMAIELAAAFIRCAVVDISRGKIANRLEACDEELSIASFELADKFEDERIDQKPPFHSGGSGISASRVWNSSKVSQRLAFGSSSFRAAARA